MKKLLLLPVIFAILLPIVVPAQVQSEKISIYIQGGYMSSGYINESVQKKLFSAKEIQDHKCIILNAGFLMKVSEKWRIGPVFTYDHFGSKHRTVEYSNLSYMLRSDRIWKENKNFLLYSGLAFGIRKTKKFEEEVETNRWIKSAYQIYLGGLELKINRFAININAGYGVSGILNAGLKYHFK